MSHTPITRSSHALIDNLKGHSQLATQLKEKIMGEAGPLQGRSIVQGRAEKPRISRFANFQRKVKTLLSQRRSQRLAPGRQRLKKTLAKIHRRPVSSTPSAALESKSKTQKTTVKQQKKIQKNFEKYSKKLEALTNSTADFAASIRKDRKIQPWARMNAAVAVSLNDLSDKIIADSQKPEAQNLKNWQKNYGQLLKAQTAIVDNLRNINDTAHIMSHGSPEEKENLKFFTGSAHLGEDPVMDAALIHISRAYNAVTGQINALHSQLSHSVSDSEFAEGSIIIGKQDPHQEVERNTNRYRSANYSVAENGATNAGLTNLLADISGRDSYLSQKYGAHAKVLEAIAHNPDLESRASQLRTVRDRFVESSTEDDYFDQDMGLNSPLEKINKKKTIKTFADNITRLRQAPLFHKNLSEEAMMEAFISRAFEENNIPESLMSEFQSRRSQAKNALFNKTEWQPIDRYVFIPSKNEDAPHYIHHRITPASHMGVNPNDMQKSYQDENIAGVNCADRLHGGHAWNLATSETSNVAGDTIYRHMRHGVIDAYLVTPKNLTHASRTTLEPIIEKFINTSSEWKNKFPHQSPTIDNSIALIRSDPKAAKLAARIARPAMNRQAALEAVKGMVLSNPEKYSDALKNGSVAITANSVSLLTPDALRKKASGNERLMLDNQVKALRDLAQESPLTLTLEKDGVPHQVTVDFNVRTFNFGVNEGAITKFGPIGGSFAPRRWAMGWNRTRPMNRAGLDALIGATRAGGLGGLCGTKIQQWEKDLAQAQADRNYFSPQQSAALGISQYEKNLTKKINSAKSLGRQINDIWNNRSYLQEGTEPYKMVSRLAVLSNILGDETMVNCKSGKDRTGEIEAAAVQLADDLDQNNGIAPTPDKIPDDHFQATRAMIALNIGNLEMQQYNTGLPGYKTQLPSLKNQLKHQEEKLTHLGFANRVKA